MSYIDIVQRAQDRLLFTLRLSCVLLLLASASASSALAAEEQPTLEYHVKANALRTFLSFVEWPTQKVGAPDSPLVFGVLGKDPFAGALEAALEGQKFNDHPLIARHISGAAEARTCHLLFISRSEGSRLPAIIKELRNSAVLTVGESEKFIARGGMINLIIEENKLRFEINPKAAGQAGLHISSKLLRLARVVTNQETADLR
jgi:hypothetical protein